MKRNTKKFLFLAAALAVLGLGLCTAALALSGFDITRLSVPSAHDRAELVRSYDPAEIDRIVMRMTWDSVTLLPSPDGQIHLRCFVGGGFTYSTTEGDMELRIEQKNTAIQRLPDWLRVNFDWDIDRNLSLSVPQGFDGDLLLEMDAGSIEIADGLELAGALDAKLDLGSFSAKSLAARSVTVRCGAGSVAGLDWRIDQYAVLTADLGDVMLSHLSAQDTTLITDAGNVEFRELAANHIEISSDLGSINGSILGVESDYSIEAHTGLGTCNLTDRQGETGNTLRLSCGAGSISVQFLPPPSAAQALIFPGRNLALTSKTVAFFRPSLYNWNREPTVF